MSDVYIRDPEKDLTYDSNTGSYVLTSSLIVTYTFTIIPTPSDATVTLTASGYNQSGNSITVEENTSISYSVSKPGYITVTNTITPTTDTTIQVQLTEVTVNPINESTTVKEIEIADVVYDVVGKGILDRNKKITRTEWHGTRTEYDALESYDSNCTYFVSDDYAHDEDDPSGGLAEEINTLKGYDYVVEAIIPSASNGYSWRRVFKSGWVEMGGQISSSTATNATVQITFPFTLQAGYFASSNTTYTGSDAPTYGAVVKAKDLTSITVGHMTGHTTNWFVSGIIM